MAGSLIDTGFQAALKRIVNSLSPAEKEDFRFSTLEDVYTEISRIQKAQGSERRLRNLTRIKAFLEGMEQYGKIVEVFLNVSDIIAFVWGPVKFLLQIASTWVESLDMLLDAYEEISENIPQLLDYGQLFENNPHMRKVLELMYVDILEFHKHALKFFKRPAWKQFFRSSWKTFNTNFQCILSNLGRHKNLIESQASLAEYEQSKLARLAAQNSFEQIAKGEKSRRLTAVIEKVHPPNSLIDHEQALEVRQEYPESGRWILREDQLKRWMDPLATDVPVLWMNGIPGAGKTVIASLIIEELKRINSVTVAFFYCKYSDDQKNSLVAALRSILAQMVQQNEEILSFVYEKCASSSEITLESPALLKELVETSLKSCSRAFILLDGVDECATGEEKRITAWLLKILENVNKDNPGSLRGVLISQRDAALERLLTSASVVLIDTSEHQKDIEAYCRVWSLRIKEKFDTKIASANQMAASVAAQADGLFLFAKLVMTNLHGQTSRRRLSAELHPDRFPKGLEAAYERIAHRVFGNPIESEREDAQRILSWVICAKRPLKWHEFQGGVFSIDTDSQTVDFEDRRLRVTSKDLCGSLIEIRPGDTIELVHRSAKSYLITTGRVSPTSEALRIAVFCLQYLNFRCFDADLTEREVQEFFQEAYYSFEDYAIVHWIDHLASCTPETVQHDPHTHQYLANQVETFLKKHGLDSPTASSTPDNEQLQIFKHWDASLRLDFVAQLAREKKSAASYLDLEAQLHRRRTIYENVVAKMHPDSDVARLITSFNGRNNYKCPKIFCEWFYEGFPDEECRKKHINQHDLPFRCTFKECLYSELGYETEERLKRHLKKSHPTDGNLHWAFPIPTRKKQPDIFSAVEAGDLESVRRCVDELGVNANTGKTEPQYMRGKTPLCLAARHNQVEVVRYLLSQGVDVSLHLKGIKTGIFKNDSALGLAVRLGHTSIVELLFEHRATIQVTRAGGAILNEVIELASLPMVKLLVENGANESELNFDLETPIERAAEHGRTDTLRYLLKKNIPGVVRTSHERSLWAAVSNGHKDAARVLFENGASFTPGTQAPFRALQSALLNHREDVNKEILDLFSQYGILKGREEIGRTALQWAAAEGNFITTRVLLSYGLLFEKGPSSISGTQTAFLALQSALINHSEDVNEEMMELLSHYDFLKAKDGSGRTTFQLAAVDGDLKTTRALLMYGLGIEYRDQNGETALQLACRGTPLSGSGHRNGTPSPASRNYYAVVQLLLEKGADAETQNRRGQTPLQIALQHNVHVMQLLLRHGVDLNVKDQAGKTALSLALMLEDQAAATILREHGGTV